MQPVPARDEDIKLRDFILQLECRKEDALDIKEEAAHDADTFREKLNHWLECDAKLRLLYGGEISDYHSRSEAELALYQKLLFYGFDDNEIDKILSDAKIGKWATENKSYREHTRKKAHQNQTERMVTFSERYLLYSRKESRIAIHFWRHKLMHTAEPRVLRDPTTNESYIWSTGISQENHMRLVAMDTPTTFMLHFSPFVFVHDLREGIFGPTGYFQGLQSDLDFQSKYRTCLTEFESYEIIIKPLCALTGIVGQPKLRSAGERSPRRRRFRTGAGDAPPSGRLISKASPTPRLPPPSSAGSTASHAMKWLG